MLMKSPTAVLTDRGVRRSRPIWLLLVGALVVLTASCDLVPPKGDDLFVLYRDRMKEHSVDKARELLTKESRDLAEAIARKYKVNETPENLALLNALDPVSPPLLKQHEDTYALLQVRTLKGGLRLVRLVRKDTGSNWRIDMAGELNALKAFLEARAALSMFRNQAVEYAASLKDFKDQLHVVSAGRRAPEETPNQVYQALKDKLPAPGGRGRR